MSLENSHTISHGFDERIKVFLYQFLLYEVGTVLELYKQNANFTCRVIDCVAKHSRTFLFFSFLCSLATLISSMFGKLS
jgi:hypothetical protein